MTDHRARDAETLLRTGVEHAARGDYPQAESAYYATIDVGAPDWTANAWFNLGAMHQQMGDVGKAVAAYRTTIALEHPEFTPKAAVNLGFVLFNMSQDRAGARAAFQLAVDSGHPVQAPLAARNLAAMGAVTDDMEAVDDNVNVADGRGPGGFKFRIWKKKS